MVFRWRANNAPLFVIFGSSLPLVNLKKTLTKLSWTSGSALEPLTKDKLFCSVAQFQGVGSGPPIALWIQEQDGLSGLFLNYLHDPHPAPTQHKNFPNYDGAAQMNLS